MKKKVLRIKNANLSIFDKTALFVIVFIIFFVMMMIGISIRSYERNQLETVQDTMGKMAENQQMVLENLLEERLADLRFIASFPEIYEMDRDRQHTFIQDRSEMIGFHHIFILDMNGIGYYIKENAIWDQSGDPFFSYIKNSGQYISEPFYMPDDRTTIITLCVSIYNEEGRKTGILCGAVDLMEIQEVLSENSTIMGGKSFIVDWNGTYLAAENMQDVYDRKSLYDVPDSKLSLVRRAFTSKSDQCGEISLNGISYQTYITYLKEYDWALIQCIKTDAVLGKIRTMTYWQYGMAALIILLGLGIVRIIYCWWESDKKINTDMLTKCYSRVAVETLMDRLEKNTRLDVVIIYMDLNNFKNVNDTYGHETGDQLLCIFADVLMKVFGKTGIVGRMGGDEFVSIQVNMPEENIKSLCDRAEEILKDKSKCLDIGYTISSSYGYAIRKKGEKESLQELLRKSDEHMYEYKAKCKQNRMGEG